MAAFQRTVWLFGEPFRRKRLHFGLPFFFYGSTVGTEVVAASSVRIVIIEAFLGMAGIRRKNEKNKQNQ